MTVTESCTLHCNQEITVETTDLELRNTLKSRVNSLYLVKSGNKLSRQLLQVVQNGVLSELKSFSDSSNVRVAVSIHGSMEIIQHRPVDNNGEKKEVFTNQALRNHWRLKVK